MILCSEGEVYVFEHGLYISALENAKSQNLLFVRVSARILSEGTPGRGNFRGFWGVSPRPEKKLNSKVSETNFGDSRLPVC